ncbi:MAG: hypothetical protein NTY38_30345 [Acidobacteria bacterium]|nr:hypothetical protein [Acidobacteriota bacterium]
MSFKQIALTAALAGAFLLPATVSADDRYRYDGRDNRQYDSREYDNRQYDNRPYDSRQYDNGYYNNNEPYMYRDSRGRWRRDQKAFRRYMKERQREARRHHEYWEDRRW